MHLRHLVLKVQPLALPMWDLESYGCFLNASGLFSLVNIWFCDSFIAYEIAFVSQHTVSNQLDAQDGQNELSPGVMAPLVRHRVGIGSA